MSDQGHDHDLVMPFITVVSKGGPHEDDAYTAGFECGRLDAWLASVKGLGAGTGFTSTVREVNVPQLDLIAMRHGFSAEKVDSPDDGHNWEGWTSLRFQQVS